MQKKILGYDCGGTKNYYSDDFLNIKVLSDFFDEIHSYDSSITKSGFKFLEEHYGIDKLVEILKEHNPGFPYDYDMDIKTYLLALKEDADDDVDE